MEDLANAFSVLELDAEDDDQAREASSVSKQKDDTTKSSGKKTEKKVNNSNDMLLVNEKESQQNPVMPPEECKLPLVWIDLEMTGLNVEVDRILEIACIITDGKLNKSVEVPLPPSGIHQLIEPNLRVLGKAGSLFDSFVFGPDLVIRQTKECLDRMGEWCQSHHAASGLTKKVLESTINEKEAEKQVIEFVKRNVGTYTPLLAGNSVYVDFAFLKKYMPDLARLFSHVIVDVSSIKALCIRWYPRDNKKAPTKENNHRAMDDIRESIRELKYFKENIFKAFKK